MPIIPGAASVTNQNISANTKGALRHCQSWCTTFFASQHSVRGVSIMGPYLGNKQHSLIWRKVVYYVANRSFQIVKGGSYSPQLPGELDRASLQDQLLHPQHVPNKLSALYRSCFVQWNEVLLQCKIAVGIQAWSFNSYVQVSCCA